MSHTFQIFKDNERHYEEKKIKKLFREPAIQQQIEERALEGPSIKIGKDFYRIIYNPNYCLFSLLKSIKGNPIEIKICEFI